MELKKLLLQKGLVQQSPSEKEIIERAKQVSPKPVKLFYGETYDNYGNTIDSMKYYFFVANLAQSLEEEGFKTDPTILVADTAACRNVSKSLKLKYMKFGNERVKFIEKIKNVYGLNLKIIRMSDYINTKEFQDKLKKIIKICKTNPKLMEKIECSVPESKIEEERKKDFAYSFDEITTIMDLDVKVGPPREDLYDNIARDIAKKLNKTGPISIYLTPTFPLGMDFNYFISHTGIEEHGITAYKAGSKRLQDHRIIVGRTTKGYANELINKSFISTNPKLPNPILDLFIICEMARQRLEGKPEPITIYDEFYSGKISPEDIKKIICKILYTKVLDKLK